MCDDCQLRHRARQVIRPLLAGVRVQDVDGDKVDGAGDDGHPPVHEKVIVLPERPLGNVVGDRDVEDIHRRGRLIKESGAGGQ